jgi:predicted CXXCH cytochrome family protein
VRLTTTPNPRTLSVGRRASARRSWGSLVLIACSLLLICAAIGCHKDERTGDASNPSTKPDAASPEHYDPDVARQIKTVTFVPAATPAPKPTGPLPVNTSCVTAACHAKLATAKQIHSPVAAAACDACHGADVGGHKYPLKRTGNATCTFCHAVAGTMTVQHKALDQGCVTCHSPHASNTKFLLKTDTIEQLCATCHNVPLKQFAHEPFAKGQCTICHQPHQAQNAMLLRNGEGSRSCFACHADTEERMALATSVHKPAAQNCMNCHSPHATEFPHQLKKPLDQSCFSCHTSTEQKINKASFAHGALKEANQCANCHDPHAAQQPELLKARTDRLCISCHDKDMKSPDGRPVPEVKTVLTKSKFLHGPNRVGNCSACHDPHGSDTADLLKRSFPKTFYTSFDLKKYDLCFGCHEPELVLEERTANLTNFRNGDLNLHYVHVNRDEKGRSCKSCHAIHGSDLPRHMASEVPFEGSKWAMPIEYQATSDGGSCAPGCHTPRSYSRSAKAGAPRLPVSASTQPTTRGVP